MLNEVLNWLNDNIDLKHLDDATTRVKKSLMYEDGAKCTVVIGGVGNGKFRGVPTQDTHLSMELMMFNELMGICDGVAVKDDRLFSIRTNYGVGTLASIFGAVSTFADKNGMPWSNHLEKDEIRRIVDKGVPDIKSGFGQKIIETYEFYAEQLEKFPALRRAIKLYHPDLQGPLDVTHLLMGNDIYYDICDEPELVHGLLNCVTDTYIALMKEVKKFINDEEDGFNYHWNTLYRGNIVLRNDTAVNISTDMYEEFVRPYDEKIIKAFGNASMHYCGERQKWLPEMLDTKGLYGINFGFVPNPNLEYGEKFLQEVYSMTQPRKISIVSYNLPAEKLPEISEKGYGSGVTFNAAVKDIHEANELLAKLRQ